MLSPVEEIKSRLDIAEFIQSYIRLQKTGANFRANCPFHGEKTPSFFVSPARQIWHCFGCGKGGDIFKFVMEIEGHDFPEALKLLAGRAGVVITREDPRLRSEKNRLYEINEEAAKIFETSLSLTPAAKMYLAKRGLAAETIKTFHVGFSPQSWDFLLNSLTKKGFKKEEIERAGLAIKSQDGSSWYDRFRSRIMFPITDPNGRVIGFGGRIFAQEGTAPAQREEAKYINTPQTVIYDKSRVLYGLDKAKQEIRVKNRVIMVEGYMDCVMSHQAGVANTIAVSGTALTPQQLTMLKRLCDTIVCSFDTDAAGESATRRSLALASEFDFKRLIARIQTGKDPADAVLESPEHWREAVEHAEPVIDFYLAKAFARFSPVTVQGKKSIAEMVLPYIGELSDAIEQAHWVSELSRKLEVPETAIWNEVSRYSEAAPRSDPGGVHASFAEERDASNQNRRELLEERFLILSSLLDEETRKKEFADRHFSFRSPLNQELFAYLTTLDDTASVLPETAEKKQMSDALALISFKGELLTQAMDDPKAEFLICRREFERDCIKERLASMGAEIGRKEQEKNHDSLNTMLQDFQKLSEILKTL